MDGVAHSSIYPGLWGPSPGHRSLAKSWSSQPPRPPGTHQPLSRSRTLPPSGGGLHYPPAPSHVPALSRRYTIDPRLDADSKIPPPTRWTPGSTGSSPRPRLSSDTAFSEVESSDNENGSCFSADVESSDSGESSWADNGNVCGAPAREPEEEVELQEAPRAPDPPPEPPLSESDSGSDDEDSAESCESEDCPQCLQEKSRRGEVLIAAGEPGLPRRERRSSTIFVQPPTPPGSDPNYLVPRFHLQSDLMHTGTPIDEDVGACRISEEEYIATLSIHESAKKGDLHVVKLLLRQDPKRMETVDERGWTPLHLAAANGHAEVVKFLGLEGAHLAALDPSGYTALHIAAMNGKHDCIQVLLQMGLGVDLVTSDGFTSLHLAALNGYVDCCRTLLVWGARLDKRDALGRTVRDMAEEYSLDEVMHLVESLERLVEDALSGTSSQISPGASSH